MKNARVWFQAITALAMLAACTVEKSEQRTRGSDHESPDTVIVSGASVLFLRPDSLTFQEHVDRGEEHIYEVDSDFGFGVAAALDSIWHSETLKGLRVDVITARYIAIDDCDGCPMIWDRDSVKYGMILTGPRMNPELNETVASFPEHYLSLVRDFFKLR